MLKEFKEFVARGNVIDLAVGVMIGGAFGKIVSSLVNDVVMPPLGLVLGKVNFADRFLNLSGTPYASLADAKAAGAATLNYGAFLNSIVEFVLIALALFIIIRQINRLKGPAPVAAPTTKECPFCFTSIPLQATRCPNCTSELH